MNLIETFKGLPAENRSETLKGFVEQVKNLKNCSNLVLAKVLYEIEKESFYKEWTYSEDGATKTFNSINDFARVTFDYSTSTTQSFIRIHQRYAVDLQVPDDRLAELPWGNLRICCPHVTEGNLEMVLKLCQGKQKDVKAWADQFSQVKDKPPKYSFTCSLDQAEIFDTALDVAREAYAAELGVPADGDTPIWEYIVSKFLQIELRPMTLVDHLTLLESRFDVKLGLVESDCMVPRMVPQDEPTVEKGTPFEELFPQAEVPEDEELPEVLSVDDFR